MRARATIARGPGVWRLRSEVLWLRLAIWRARRRHDRRPALLADVHRRLAKEYAVLARHRSFVAAGWRAARLARRAAIHAREAQWWGHLDALRRGEGGALGAAGRRGAGPRGPEPIAAPHPRGPRPPGRSGAAAAELEEEYARTRAVAGAGERERLGE